MLLVCRRAGGVRGWVNNLIFGRSVLGCIDAEFAIEHHCRKSVYVGKIDSILFLFFRKKGEIVCKFWRKKVGWFLDVKRPCSPSSRIFSNKKPQELSL